MSDPDVQRETDLLTLVKILEAAPVGGLSIEDISVEVAKRKDSWTYRTINDLLCGLGGKVQHEKIRLKSGKVTKYQLRSPQR